MSLACWFQLFHPFCTCSFLRFIDVILDSPVFLGIGSIYFVVSGILTVYVVAQSALGRHGPSPLCCGPKWVGSGLHGFSCVFPLCSLAILMLRV
ncbi:hypothetical protein ASPBRDRAFT_36178 [Aspergillus brasiliensis CBS 101740]|uniref:Uncharacterized protein n=1 Tax=Aspergillus brasiliensis (strain CBS 101740 / IMI 381727 / IBT 21946) TaxID=767769 RepID=A0A1L9UZ89_ASPBC|nr:hypothetical protein ASPBRDRAFT_36178 [Aspergillus brasiliensis CBS 101740]